MVSGCLRQQPAGSKALIDPKKLHPINQWYAVEQTYDGKTYRSYVNGVLENEGEVAFTPHGPGHMMVGVRMNRVNYFKGSVAEARFTDPRAQAERISEGRVSGHSLGLWSVTGRG